MYQAPRGTDDVLPEEFPYWQYIQETAASFARRYGHQPIRTPMFEQAGVFIRAVGEGTDIVEKEMFYLRTEEDLVLRPEGTAAVCRAYLEHGMFNLPQPVRLFYFAEAFRYERPQAGRLRQHTQFGVEAIGEEDPALDAELIDMLWRLYASLGLQNLTLLLNSIGDRACRPRYLEVLKAYYADKLEDVCRDCRTRYERNPLRLLDCKQESCQPVIAAAPVITDYLCEPCRRHFDRLQEYLTAIEIPYTPAPRLVRGLDYYTRTVFEVVPEGAGSQGTIGAGGRYDGLMEELGGRPTPGIGFATGIERIILNLKQQGLQPPEVPGVQAYVAHLGDAARLPAVRLTRELRAAGIRTVMGLGGRSLRAQLRHANAVAARYVLIIGDEEAASDTVQFRDMAEGAQQRLPRGEAILTLSHALGTEVR
ncbi:MAG TPA: histidine--tRNA ligase [Dehalococcoidia bacterium]